MLNNLRHTAAVIVGANVAGFSITALLNTHKITDLFGVGSFVLATAFLSAKQLQLSLLDRSKLLDNRLFWINAGVILWGSRLALFLFNRILLIEEDHRLKKFFPVAGEGWLDSKRSNFPVNLAAFWSIQAAWGCICMLPVTFVNSIDLTKTPLLSLSNTAETISEGLGSRINVPASLRPFLTTLGLTLAWAPIIGIVAGRLYATRIQPSPLPLHHLL